MRRKNTSKWWDSDPRSVCLEGCALPLCYNPDREKDREQTCTQSSREKSRKRKKKCVNVDLATCLVKSEIDREKHSSCRERKLL